MNFSDLKFRTVKYQEASFDSEDHSSYYIKSTLGPYYTFVLTITEPHSCESQTLENLSSTDLDELLKLSAVDCFLYIKEKNEVF